MSVVTATFGLAWPGSDVEITAVSPSASAAMARLFQPTRATCSDRSTRSSASGLASRGDGNWRFTWQPSRQWASTWRLATVEFADSSTPSVEFLFR